MTIRSAIQNISRHALAAIVAVGLAAPALAGGPFEAPDDTGPSATDFTGWTPLAFVYGGLDDANTISRILCVNVGTADTLVAAQWYDTGDDPTRQPALENIIDLPPSDMDVGLQTGGTINNTVFARLLVRDKKARIHCAGRTEESGEPKTSLEVVYLKKIPKVRIAK